ncbi:hypothetical protein Tco_1283267 [Tanacetum coccineum]
MVGGNGVNQFRQYAGRMLESEMGIMQYRNSRIEVGSGIAVQNLGVSECCSTGAGDQKKGCCLYLQTQFLIAQKEEAGIQLKLKEYDLDG